MSTDSAPVAPTTTTIPTTISSTPNLPNFCRSDSPDTVTWINDHAPDSRPVIDVRHVSRHTGVPNPLPGGRTYKHQEETRRRQELIQRATHDDTKEEEELTEDDLHFEASRTLVCNASRTQLWKVIMRRVKHPHPSDYQACGIRNIKIQCEGLDYLYREMDVGLEEDFTEHVKQKVTWDESNESVRFDLMEDEKKDGYFECAISTDASAHVCLTVSCNWNFHMTPDVTRSSLSKWSQRLRTGIDMMCACTVKQCEDEAKEAAMERRRRNSQSVAKEVGAGAVGAGVGVNERIEKERQEKKSSEHLAPPTNTITQK